MAASRLDLIAIEAEELRDHVQFLLGLALGLMVMSVLAGLCLSAALVLLLWPLGPVMVLVGIACAWVLGAVILYRCLFSGLRRWRPFAASLDQLRKDRIFVAEHLS